MDEIQAFEHAGWQQWKTINIQKLTCETSEEKEATKETAQFSLVNVLTELFCCRQSH